MARDFLSSGLYSCCSRLQVGWRDRSRSKVPFLSIVGLSFGHVVIRGSFTIVLVHVLFGWVGSFFPLRPLGRRNDRGRGCLVLRRLGVSSPDLRLRSCLAFLPSFLVLFLGIRIARGRIFHGTVRSDTLPSRGSFLFSWVGFRASSSSHGSVPSFLSVRPVVLFPNPLDVSSVRVRSSLRTCIRSIRSGRGSRLFVSTATVPLRTWTCWVGLGWVGCASHRSISRVCLSCVWSTSLLLSSVRSIHVPRTSSSSWVPLGPGSSGPPPSRRYHPCSVLGPPPSPDRVCVWGGGGTRGGGKGTGSFSFPLPSLSSPWRNRDNPTEPRLSEKGKGEKGGPVLPPGESLPFLTRPRP